jgi:hypothetical protein
MEQRGVACIGPCVGVARDEAGRRRPERRISGIVDEDAVALLPHAVLEAVCRPCMLGSQAGRGGRRQAWPAQDHQWPPLQAVLATLTQPQRPTEQNTSDVWWKHFLCLEGMPAKYQRRPAHILLSTAAARSCLSSLGSRTL